jgi:cytochrome c-type biogenesis protein CcmH
MNRGVLAVVFLLGSAGAVVAQPPPSVAGPDPRSVVGSPRGAARSEPALGTETDRVSALLRCPVCQGLSVADSPTGMALNMRQQVREMVAAGYDDDQILTYFEKSYGEFVRLKPPLRGVNWLVWTGPLAGLALGAFVVRRVLRARATSAGAAATPPTADEALPGPDTLPEDPSLAEYVLRVRERAYGWPGGIAPVAPTVPAMTGPEKPVG